MGVLCGCVRETKWSILNAKRRHFEYAVESRIFRNFRIEASRQLCVPAIMQRLSHRESIWDAFAMDRLMGAEGTASCKIHH